MEKIFFILMAFTTLNACNRQTANEKTTNDMNPDFDRFKNSFIDELWKIYPSWAAMQGYHRYDSVLVIPDNKQRALEVSFAKSNLDSGFSPPSLNIRSASFRAASTWIVSFIKASAWSGVFVFNRRAVQTSRSGASNVARVGCGTVRFQNV